MSEIAKNPVKLMGNLEMHQVFYDSAKKYGGSGYIVHNKSAILSQQKLL